MHNLIFPLIRQPNDSSVNNRQTDVFQHQRIKTKLNGVEAYVLFYHVVKRREERLVLLLVVLTVKTCVCLVVKDYKASITFVAIAIIIVQHIKRAADELLQVLRRIMSLDVVISFRNKSRSNIGNPVSEDGSQTYHQGMTDYEVLSVCRSL